MAKGVLYGFMKMCLAVDRLKERGWDEGNDFVLGKGYD